MSKTENGVATAKRTTVRPIGDQILIRQVDAASFSPGGIAIPDEARERPKEGIVLAIGHGSRSPVTGERLGLDVKPGDRVIFAKYAGAETKIDGEELMLISERELLAILE